MDGESALQQIVADGLKLARMGGGGDVTRFVRGYMVCESDLSEILLNGLPAVFKVNIREDESCRWLEETIRYSITQAGVSDSDSKAVLAKLCETLFAETRFGAARAT